MIDLGLALVERSDLVPGASDRAEVGGRDPALRLELVGAQGVDVAERGRGGRARLDRRGQRLLRRDPALALLRPGGRGEPLRRLRRPRNAESPLRAWLTSSASRPASAASTGRSFIGRTTGTRGSIASAARGGATGAPATAGFRRSARRRSGRAEIERGRRDPAWRICGAKLVRIGRLRLGAIGKTCALACLHPPMLRSRESAGVPRRAPRRSCNAG